MNLVLLGPPGSGKGTQGELLAQRHGWPKLSTGDILREAVAAGTELGKKVEPIMAAGDLVPDEIVLGIVRERLAGEDCREGFILDGFPRTIPQAEGLEEILRESGRALSAVIEIRVSEEEVVRRLSGRRTCSQCNAIYHVEWKPPREEGVCDICGGKLVQRPDDRPEAIRERLREYREQTAPLVAFYEKRGLLRPVDGAGKVEEVAAAIEQQIAALR